MTILSKRWRNMNITPVLGQYCHNNSCYLIGSKMRSWLFLHTQIDLPEISCLYTGWKSRLLVLDRLLSDWLQSIQSARRIAVLFTSCSVINTQWPVHGLSSSLCSGITLTEFGIYFEVSSILCFNNALIITWKVWLIN